MAKKESADERAWFEKEIEAQERDVPPGRPGIKWKLLTHLPVQSRAEAIGKLDWYAMRWKIETFHKILKSGRKAEDSKLRTADRLANLISVFCILNWRIFWLTMISRCAPQAPAQAVFTFGHGGGTGACLAVADGHSLIARTAACGLRRTGKSSVTARIAAAYSLVL